MVLQKTNSINSIPFFYYMKRDDKMDWKDFIRASLDDFRKKHGYYPIYITMNPADKEKVLGNAKGVRYHKHSITVRTAKNTLKLHLWFHY